MFWKDCLVSVVFPLKGNITYMEFLLKKKKKNLMQMLKITLQLLGNGKMALSCLF